MKAHLFKHGAIFIDSLLEFGLDTNQAVVQPLTEQGDVGQKIAKSIFEPNIAGLGPQVGEIAGDEADVPADGHAVVVEHNHQLVFATPSVAQPLVGESTCQGAVTDNRHHIAVLSRQGFRLGHAVGGGDGGATMSRDEGVVFALARPWEPAQAVFLAEGMELFHPPGEQLVGIALMPHVPDQAIQRRIKNLMQSHRQLHHPQIGGQMAAGLRDGLN